MKTTVDLNESLVKKAKQMARVKGQTFKTVIEHGIRLVLQESANEKGDFELQDARVSGNGLSPEFESAAWSKIRDATYEDRGS